MQEKLKPREADNIDTYNQLFNTISNAIKMKASRQNTLVNILEAGCGRRWKIDLSGISYILTGVDIDKKALEIRQNERKDLNIAIHADLQTVSLNENYYDVIFSYNVLEHISGAELMLLNFMKWLNKDGIMILRFPNRDSVQGFITSITPFFFHVLYKKILTGDKNAGKPGFDPYPTVFDKVVSRQGIYKFCKKHDLNILAEYRIDLTHRNEKSSFIWFITRLFLWIVHILSFNTLTVNYYGLLFIINKSKE